MPPWCIYVGVPHNIPTAPSCIFINRTVGTRINTYSVVIGMCAACLSVSALDSPRRHARTQLCQHLHPLHGAQADGRRPVALQPGAVGHAQRARPARRAAGARRHPGRPLPHPVLCGQRAACALLLRLAAAELHRRAAGHAVSRRRRSHSRASCMLLAAMTSLPHFHNQSALTSFHGFTRPSRCPGHPRHRRYLASPCAAAWPTSRSACWSPPTCWW